MTGSVRLYMEYGVCTGSFLTALLSNDLMGSFDRADDDNRAAMFEWCLWLRDEAPSGSYGSPENFRRWCDERQMAIFRQEDMNDKE